MILVCGMANCFEAICFFFFFFALDSKPTLRIYPSLIKMVFVGKVELI